MGRILLLEEDDKLAYKIMELINSMEIHAKICCTKNVGEAYKCAMEQDIELFLVDIDMKELSDVSSLRFIHNIRDIDRYKFTPVVILSELLDAEKAIYNYIHCYSFIEKPFDNMRLKMEIQKIVNLRKRASTCKTLFLKKEGVLYKILLEKIVYMESHNHMLEIYTVDGCMKFPYITCGDVIDKISSDTFTQCNKSTVVNKMFIEAVDIVNRYVILSNNYGNLDIGPAFKKKFIAENCS